MTAGAWLPPIGRRQLLTFGALLVLFLVPWPGIGRAFAAAFAVYATGVLGFSGVGAQASPTFQLPAPGAVSAADGGDWAVLLASQGNPGVPLDTRILAFTPLAIFLALALATAVPRRRKLSIVGAGLALLGLRLAVAIALPVARGLGGGQGSPLGELAWFTLFAPPAMSYATPLGVWWIALTFTTPKAKAKAPAARATPAFVTQKFRKGGRRRR